MGATLHITNNIILLLIVLTDYVNFSFRVFTWKHLHDKEKTFPV